jgi:cation diffusion facilitator family transporter
LWVVLGLNLAVAAAKLAVGWRADSLSMVADGFHSLLDGSSNVIGLVGMTWATQPPDDDHHYGHHKYEAIAALAIGVLLALTALEVVRAGIARFRSPVLPDAGALSLAVMFVTMAVNLAVSRYEGGWGRRLKSELLLADSQHTFSDLFVSGSVLAGLAAARFGVAWADPLIAFVIAAFIVRIAYTVLRQVTYTLTDSSTLAPDEVCAVARGVAAVQVCKHVRSRGVPPFLFIDLEIEVDPALPLGEAHQIAHRVVDACKAQLHATDVVVHVEPLGGG